ncbi:MAG: SH3 domain-containing protein [Chloroflexi bacterium]|nr:SH3 domain-containing protein [Chloroflexota bacterium]
MDRAETSPVLVWGLRWFLAWLAAGIALVWPGWPWWILIALTLLAEPLAWAYRGGEASDKGITRTTAIAGAAALWLASLGGGAVLGFFAPQALPLPWSVRIGWWVLALVGGWLIAQGEPGQAKWTAGVVALSAAVFGSAFFAGAALGQGSWAVFWAALHGSILAFLWAWAVSAATWSAQQRPVLSQPWMLAVLFFVATLGLAGFAFTGSTPLLAAANLPGAAQPTPSPYPELARTLTAIAQGEGQEATTPAPSPTPAPSETPSPTPSPSPPPATPTETATPTPLFANWPTPTPLPTWPPPPVQTGYGVVKAPEAWGGAAIRMEPGLKYDVIRYVPNGTLLKVIKYRVVPPQVWLKVRDLQETWEGWILSDLVQVATPAP